MYVFLLRKLFVDFVAEDYAQRMHNLHKLSLTPINGSSALVNGFRILFTGNVGLNSPTL